MSSSADLITVLKQELKLAGNNKAKPFLRLAPSSGDTSRISRTVSHPFPRRIALIA